MQGGEGRGGGGGGWKGEQEGGNQGVEWAGTLWKATEERAGTRILEVGGIRRLGKICVITKRWEPLVRKKYELGIQGLGTGKFRPPCPIH